MRSGFCILATLCVFNLHTGRAQQSTRLTLEEADRLAIQNNPQFTAAKFNAAAAYQRPAAYRSNLSPTVFSNLTGVGADAGSRLAAGGLNNPVVYNRLGSGLSISQLITDFGRTSNLVAAASLHAKAEDQQFFSPFKSICFQFLRFLAVALTALNPVESSCMRVCGAATKLTTAVITEPVNPALI